MTIGMVAHHTLSQSIHCRPGQDTHLYDTVLELWSEIRWSHRVAERDKHCHRFSSGSWTLWVSCGTRRQDPPKEPGVQAGQTNRGCQKDIDDARAQGKLWAETIKLAQTDSGATGTIRGGSAGGGNTELLGQKPDSTAT
ncbi:hypothetical protein AOLI_G00321700 [Acnodon oligacanthus]